MAGACANIVHHLHVRGNEFRDSFNDDNKSENVLNPALITIEV